MLFAMSVKSRSLKYPYWISEFGFTQYHWSRCCNFFCVNPNSVSDENRKQFVGEGAVGVRGQGEQDRQLQLHTRPRRAELSPREDFVFELKQKGWIKIWRLIRPSIRIYNSITSCSATDSRYTRHRFTPSRTANSLLHRLLWTQTSLKLAGNCTASKKPQNDRCWIDIHCTHTAVCKCADKSIKRYKYALLKTFLSRHGFVVCACFFFAFRKIM